MIRNSDDNHKRRIRKKSKTHQNCIQTSKNSDLNLCKSLSQLQGQTVCISPKSNGILKNNTKSIFSIIIINKFLSKLYSFYSVSEGRKVHFRKILLKIFKILNAWVLNGVSLSLMEKLQLLKTSVLIPIRYLAMFHVQGSKKQK